MTPVTSEPIEGGASRRGHLYLALVLAGTGFALLAPTRIDIAILLREVMRSIGVASLSAAGMISTATLLGDGLTEMFCGQISDRWGRGGTMAIGLALVSIFSVLTAVATTLPTLYLVRILLGVGQAVFIPAYFAFVGSISTKRRGLLLGSLGGLFTIGVAINPILTRAMFRASGDWRTPFIAYGVFGLALSAFIYVVSRGRARIYSRHVLPRPTSTFAAVPAASRTAWLTNRNMVLLLITMGFWGLTQYGFLGIFVTYLRTDQHFSLRAAVGVASIAGWCSFGFSFVAGWMSDHIGRRWSLLIFGLVAVLLAAPLFVMHQTFASAAILAALFQAANGSFYPLGVAYAQDFAKSEGLGAHSGAVSGIGHLAAGIAGLLAGFIASHLGYGAVGWFFVAASIVMEITVALTIEPRRTALGAAPAPEFV